MGGTASAALIAGGVGTGVTLSVIAGVFTFGIGTVVGLSVTAVATGVAGVGAGVGAGISTSMLADHFDKAKVAFSDLISEFNELLHNASSMRESCLMIRKRLCTISNKIDDIKFHKQQKHTMQLICDELDLLCSKLKEHSETTSKCRCQLKARTQN